MIESHYVMRLSYDGTSFYGWQDNNTLPTIEGELKKVLSCLFQKEIELNAASRTDRGVHAEGQIVSFSAPQSPKTLNQLHLSINQLLPKEIRVLDFWKVDTPFSPSVAAKEKTYVYQIDNARFHNPFLQHIAWHLPYSLDLGSMRETAELLLGTHDFSGFTNEGCPDYNHTTRTLSLLTISEEGTLLTITMQADAFLYRMARNIVGTLVAVGRKQMTPLDVKAILEHKDRTKAGVTAPAHGLVLKQIRY